MRALEPWRDLTAHRDRLGDADQIGREIEVEIRGRGCARRVAGQLDRHGHTIARRPRPADHRELGIAGRTVRGRRE
jgi:hypothetical protein